MLSDSQIGTIVQRELDSALAYEGEIGKKREKLMDAYNQRPYGDEVEGQSKIVTSDVSDTVEWMLPSLLRIFTQGRYIAYFSPVGADDEQEAREKTQLSNYLFTQENQGVLILNSMFKDALLQYTGTVKVYWDETEDTTITKYANMSEMEYQTLLARPEVEALSDVEVEDGPEGKLYSCSEVKITKTRGIQYQNIPPEEMLISKSARDFKNPTFIGHRSPKTRSDLIEMGFDRDLVKNLPADEYYEYSGQKNARYHDYDNWQDVNPGQHSPNDIVYLGEYYLRMDVNEDGVTEYWQVFYAGNRVLEKTQVDEHPFAVCVPVPIPHRAIGTCPAEQAADIQYRKTHLVRQMHNNIYHTNFPRFLHSNMVELDDLLTPRSGGLVGVDTDNPDVAGHAAPLVVQPIAGELLQAIEFADNEREVRTGVTRYNQGLDSESLNKTATGFKGIMDASQQRLDLIARMFADGGVREIFEKTVKLLGKYQDPRIIRLSGKPLEIDPQRWSENSQCHIDVGIGAGDRQEKILNLNVMLQRQLEFMQMGIPLSDATKAYNTLEKLVTEVGLKDVEKYFNNPEVPEELLYAKARDLFKENEALKSQLQSNPLAEAEMVKAQARLIEAQGKGQTEMQKAVMKMAQEDKQFAATLAKDLTKLELEYGVDLPGGAESLPDEPVRLRYIPETGALERA